MKEVLVHKLINDCMTPYLITIGPYATLAEAYEIMQKNYIRHLPVVEKDKLIGMLSLSDILDAKPSDIGHSQSKAELNKNLSSIYVDMAMNRNPVVIYQTDTLGHAAELMLDEKIGGLPVVDIDGNLVGLLTESDIYRTIVRKWRDDNTIKSAVA